MRGRITLAAALMLASCGGGHAEPAGTTTTPANVRAQGAACTTEYRTIEVAIAAYRADHQQYPRSIDDLDHLIDTPSEWWTLDSAGAIVATDAGVEAGCTPPG